MGRHDRSTRALTSLALALVCARSPASLAAAPPEAAAPASDDAPADEAETKAKAKAEVKLAGEAFAAGDYATAIAHYEAAMALLPAPKLHYNIGVCHQRLSLQTEDPSERTRRRDLAIESYNRYLELNPRAEDRLEVAEIIRELGGTPVINTPLKSVSFGDTQPGDAQTGDPASDPDQVAIEPPPEPAPPERYYPHHGRFAVLLTPGLGSGLIRNEDVGAPALFGVDLHGGGFVGEQRRFFMGVHTAIYGGISRRGTALAFGGVHFGLLAQQQWVVAHERVAIGLGFIADLASQSIGQRSEAGPPACSLQSGTTVGIRYGGALGGRLDLSVLLGWRRRGMLTFMALPAIDIFGQPRTGGDCQPGETPWSTLGLADRWQFTFFAGLGYGFRF